MPNEKIQRRQEKQRSALLDALKKGSTISGACKATSISRETFYRWMREDAYFPSLCEDAQAEGTDLMNDIGESHVKRAVRQGDMSTIKWFLRHHHPGYQNGAYERRQQLRSERHKGQGDSDAMTFEDKCFEETRKEYEERLFRRITKRELPPLPPWPPLKDEASEQDDRQNP